MTDRRTVRTWAEVDLDALAHNYRLLRGLAPEAKFLGLVKADAYGHGAVEVSRTLEELGAECRMDIQIGDEEQPYMELCQILSNGLENACDALKGLAVEKREISVQMKYNRKHLIIRIRNRCREELCVKRGEIPATSKEGHDHGFGLATVREAAERLEGEMFCYTENGNFVLDVMVLCDSVSGEGI